MKRITDFIVEKRNYILILFTVLAIFSIIISKKVNINYDMSKYLPSSSETRIGLDISEREFKDTSSSFKIMFKGLDEDEKKDIYNYLTNVSGVSEIKYDETEDYNKEDYTLYIVSVNDTSDSKLASSVFKTINDKYKDYEISMSGDIYDRNSRVLPVTTVIIAVTSALIILIIMCESYTEPFLYLIAIGLAVALNKGSNIIFPHVSNITDSICAILQMALSMDYSIMLMNRYRQEREQEKDKVTAMKKALHHAFASISSSSVTTVVGLLALVFMSFTIGRDLGLVLAKGVIFSLISIFFCLPSLILMSDKLIKKTKKKSPIFKLDKLAKFGYKIRYIALLLFILCLGISYKLKGNLGILYSNNVTDQIVHVFNDNNQMAIIYKNEDEEIIGNYCKQLENNEKIDSVICYSNTINEQLKYNEVNDKISTLGSDTKIEEYLIKIIYYNYYNNNTEKMTFDEFVNFIKKEIYNSEFETKDIKNEIDLLSNFTDQNLVNKKRSKEEIADILGIPVEKVEELLIYYGSINNNSKMTINEFVNFMNGNVLKNKRYASYMNQNINEEINELSKFTNVVNSKLSYKEMAKLFGIDEDLVNKLYLYYVSQNDINIKLTLNDFATYVISNKLDESDSIKQLKKYSDIDFINKDMHSEDLAKNFEIEENLAKKILLLKYQNINDDSKINIVSFVKALEKIRNNEEYSSLINYENMNELIDFSKIDIDKMDKEELKKIFKGLSEALVDEVYNALELDKIEQLTPIEFIDYAINNYKDIDENTIEKLKNIKVIMENKINDEYSYTSIELANIFGLDPSDTAKVYALINYVNDNTDEWVITPKEFVDIALEQEKTESLEQLKVIMDNSETLFTYEDLATFIGINSDTVKNIYTLYQYDMYGLSLTPLEFVNFIIKHQNDELLKGKLNESDIKNIKLIKNIMDGVVINKNYTSLELSSTLDVEKNKLDLVYSLYNKEDMISLKEFINFLVNDVITNSQLNGNFTKESIKKITTIDGIIKSVENHTMYTKDEMIAILSNLTDEIDKNMVDLLYMYYGSYNNYNESWTMTLEQLINYVNSNILTDQRFSSFIDEEMKNNIKNSTNKINDAKKLLVGANYSRAVLNTSYEIENDETFNFIENVKTDINNEIDDFYVIGSSPMSYEMSKSFNKEFNMISILTMIFIFVVVAITFKSLIIPLILVLTIQCSVYMTMCILSFSGEDVYFIAILIVQSILMGATIDYAILYTSYYAENRKTKDRINSLVTAYNDSMHTILTSASILIIVTLIVGNVSTATSAKICKTISEGTICSTVLILVLLPGVLASFDKLIIKKDCQEIK